MGSRESSKILISDKTLNPGLTDRLLSLDIFRGVIMLFLLLEGAFLYENLVRIFGGNSGVLLPQFFHAPWIGLRFWDLIQPGFMFVAGTAMTLSLKMRISRNESIGTWVRHVFVRSFLLFGLGVGLHWMYSGEPVFELQNVLTQLAFTTLLTALVIRFSLGLQLGMSLVVLILSSFIYRIYAPGAPFVPGRNAGSALDIFLSGYADSDYWVSLNFLSTSAHTIWGAMTGWILIGDWTRKKKAGVLLVSATIFIGVGLFLHFTGIEPMIKRIATVSFVLVSGGISILTLLILYLVIDQKEKHRNPLLSFFSVIGLNSLLLYLFSQTVGTEFFYDFLDIYIQGIGGWVHIPGIYLALITSLLLVTLEWALVKWLAGKNIRIKI